MAVYHICLKVIYISGGSMTVFQVGTVFRAVFSNAVRYYGIGVQKYPISVRYFVSFQLLGFGLRRTRRTGQSLMHIYWPI
jgi:hypothetical protein